MKQVCVFKNTRNHEAENNLEHQINEWIKDCTLDLEDGDTFEVVDIKFVMTVGEDWTCYAAMVIYETSQK